MQDRLRRGRPRRQRLHNADKVFIIAAWRNGQATAFSELDNGDNASKFERRQIAKQIERVIRGLGKSCKIATPTTPAIYGD